MASGTPSAHKRSSLHRLSHTLLSLAAPAFPRVSFDAQAFGSRKKTLSPVKTHAASTHTTSSLDPRDTAYSPSLVSAVDSQLSTPFALLLPSPRSPAPVPAAVPPTTNDLPEEEKMKLMRKVRKLSRVLGEIPSVEEEDTEHSDAEERTAARAAHRRSTSMDAAAGSMMRTASASAKKAFRRSLTFGAASGALLAPHDVRHTRSLSALRPSLNLPRAPHPDAPGTPSSPITFARPESALSHGDADADVAPLRLSSSAAAPHPGEIGLRRRDSTASSVLLADQNVEQVQRTRAAKLSRHFGTSIPPDVLFRAASPQPQPPASPTALFPVPSTRVLGAEELPRRSASLRRRPNRPRPASLDIRSGQGLSFDPTSPLSPRANSEHRRTLKRSKSLWSKRPKTSDGSESRARDEVVDAEIGVPSLSEKQRIQNVKRAKKMAQLFGDNPPSALFQVTNFAGAVVEPTNSTDTHRYERDSLATIISISTTSLSPSISGTNKVRLRDSFISVVTTSSEVSGLILTEKADEDEDEDDRDSVIMDEKDDATDSSLLPPLPILSPVPIAKRKSTRPSTSPTAGPNRSGPRTLPVPLSPLAHVPRTPPTPPPFSNLLPPLEPRPATAPPASPARSEFQTRRRRAAKLSQFFGVDVNALADALPPDPGMTRQGSLNAGAPAVAFDDVALVYRQQPHDASLVVAEATRRQFWRTNEDEVERRDVHEVIDRLRRL